MEIAAQVLRIHPNAFSRKFQRDIFHVVIDIVFHAPNHFVRLVFRRFCFFLNRFNLFPVLHAVFRVQLLPNLGENLHDLRVLHRLDQIVPHAHFHHLLRIVKVTVSADDHNLHVHARVPHGLDQLDSAHAAHPDIRHQHVRLMFLEVFFRFLRAFKIRPDFKSDFLPREIGAETPPDFHLIIDHDHRVHTVTPFISSKLEYRFSLCLSNAFRSIFTILSHMKQSICVKCA